MKKLLTLTFLGLCLLTCNLSANDYPYLSDVVAKNLNKDKDQQAVQQAAAVIIHINNNIPFRSLAKNFTIEFDEGERDHFEEILLRLPKPGLGYIINAFNDGDLHLERDDIYYTLSYKDEIISEFRLGTGEDFINAPYKKTAKENFSALKNTLNRRQEIQYKRYLKILKDETQTLEDIILALRHIKYACNDTHKKALYMAVLKRSDLTAEALNIILDGAKIITQDGLKKLIYTEYLKRNDVDSVTAFGLFNESKSWKFESQKREFQKTYFAFLTQK